MSITDIFDILSDKDLIAAMPILVAIVVAALVVTFSMIGVGVYLFTPENIDSHPMGATVPADQSPLTTRRGASPPTSPSCRSWCERSRTGIKAVGTGGQDRTEGYVLLSDQGRRPNTIATSELGPAAWAVAERAASRSS